MVFDRLRSRAGERWSALKGRRPLVRHVVSAWQLMQRNNGNQYAAAITYFSFLALFPLLLLAVSITGFILRAHPGAEQDLYSQITSNVPGGLGRTLKSSLRAAIDSRAGLGIIGLVGVLYTGLGWVGNVRAAIDGVWGLPTAKTNFVKAKLANLVVLAGLGVGSLVSVGLTVIGTSLTDQILRALGLDDLPGATLLLKLLGIAIAVLSDIVIFWWLLIRLPEVEVPTRIAIKAALLASVGFEVLKVLGSFTIAHTADSPTAGPFAGLLAVLIWIQLVARLLLFTCAWAATLVTDSRPITPNTLPIEEPAPMADAESRELSPAAVGASLVAGGALAGAAATWALTRPGAAEERPPRRG